MKQNRLPGCIATVVILGLGITSAPARAELFSWLPPSVQIHGFLSQGAIWTSENNFFGDSEDDISLNFRELGLNASWRPFPSLQFSSQVLSREAGNGDDGDLRIDYGFVDYAFIADMQNLWGLRAGRVLNPYGLYNDTRDVAFLRPSILLPESIYFDTTRTLSLSGDGLQLYGERRNDWGDLFFQFSAIQPRVDDPETEQELFAGDAPGDLQPDPSFLSRLIYEYDGGRVRLAASALSINVDYKPGEMDFFQEGRFRFNALYFSAQYNALNWSLTGEYALRNFRFRKFGPALPDNTSTGESFYIQGTYRFTPTLEGLIRYDVLYADRDDRDGSDFAAATGLPAHRRFARDFTLGLRWDVTRSLMLRAEYHNINGTGWLPFVDNPDILGTEQHWKLFSVLASYRF